MQQNVGRTSSSWDQLSRTRAPVPATVPFGNITKILQLTPSRFLVLPLRANKAISRSEKPLHTMKIAAVVIGGGPGGAGRIDEGLGVSWFTLNQRNNMGDI
jgi:hypothetical protein